MGFELHLRQSWVQRVIGRFSGTVTDEPQRGMPGIGQITGGFRGQSIRFTKRMPVSYIVQEGRSISVRQWLCELGYDPGRDIPHQPVLYRGRFSSADAASGTWRIPGGNLNVSLSLSIPMPECTGTWTLTR
ncbi:hypothetical protein OKA05_26750 [Luteolibacter arcticus]|uniref:Phage tail protein n=1 Tax=Luteolibacter arcticus TaxID=1581411 RepID=A0ABT3GRT4_9BACT|nr:hypothetical protein [Luteolibacter arcticus]MCW1926186.1 hypothetical protein [Luteolibacter arcticus]